MQNWKNLSLHETFAGLRPAACVLLAAAVFVCGCGGSPGKTQANSNTPSTYNNYAGTQSYDLVNPSIPIETGGVWNVTLDDTNNFFTYTPISIPPHNFGGGGPPYPIEGSTKTANGFLDLTLDGGSPGSGGYALEIPGSAAIFRPGNDSTFPVIAAAASTSGCQGLAQQTTFEFLTLQPTYYSQSNRPIYAAYGSIEASSKGTAWTFSNLQMYTLSGAALNPPTPTAGLCTYTEEGYVTYINPSTETQNLPWTVAVAPSGYMILDQGQGNFTGERSPISSAIGPFGLAGFPQPSNQIDTGSLVAGKYIGFTFDSDAPGVSNPASQPIAFSGGTGAVITGGLYPNDDVKKSPPSNITMNLGQEDPKTNGLYPSVTVTMPDTYNGCAGQSYGGTDANGNPTCTAYGIAIAGSLNGKFALYVALGDRSLETRGVFGAELEYFLYQQ